MIVWALSRLMWPNILFPLGGKTRYPSVVHPLEIHRISTEWVVKLNRVLTIRRISTGWKTGFASWISTESWFLYLSNVCSAIRKEKRALRPNGAKIMSHSEHQNVLDERSLASEKVVYTVASFLIIDPSNKTDSFWTPGNLNCWLFPFVCLSIRPSVRAFNSPLSSTSQEKTAPDVKILTRSVKEI